MFRLPDPSSPIVIATHERSGTHLTIDLLRRQFRECGARKAFGERMDRLYLSLEALIDEASPLREKAAMRILRRAPRPLIKTHALPTFNPWRKGRFPWLEEILQNATMYYCVRDGRDVVCSLHRFMQGYSRLAQCPLSEFLRQKVNGISRPKVWALHVARWLEAPKVRVLRFEEIITTPADALRRLGRELGIQPKFREPLLPRRLRGVWHSRWARLTRRCPESTAIVPIARGGKESKWRDAFTREDREFFHQEAGDLLIRLGYEPSDAWVEGSGRAREAAAQIDLAARQAN
jgi:hypothetical protein